MENFLLEHGEVIVSGIVAITSILTGMMVIISMTYVQMYCIKNLVGG